MWDLGAFFDSGGMPSSHSSLCSSVTTAIAMQQGLGSPLFSVAVCFRWAVLPVWLQMGRMQLREQRCCCAARASQVPLCLLKRMPLRVLAAA